LAACTGVRWETETAQILMHDALYFTGEWGLLARELPARRQETEQRGDLYSAAFVAARMGPLVQLAADRSDLAQWEVQRSLSQWTKRIVSLQHRFVVCTALDIALYENRPDDAAQTLAEAWPKLRGMLFAIQHHRIEMTFYRARVALALAATGEAAALRRAERDARRLTGERARWAQAFAALVRAAAAAIRSRPTVAADELTTAETAFRDCDMNLFAAAAQYRRGSLVGGDEGHILSESALAWMRDHGIVNPARLTGLLTPGFGPPER
jgi:hypothetical protein